MNLSVSIDLGGATTVPQGSDDRGTHLKINKDTGAVEYVAGGLRTPHGIGWGPEDEIFVTDNQGGWLPANKLIHLQPGKFYNHYTTGPTGEPGRFDDERPTPPALWLPHNEIANSPSQPMLIPSGPFAGQMWIADVTYGGIQRAFLEKVEGEYQGAYFRMTQGLESGITHLLLEDDGSIIVGGLGAGGNWGQTGKLQFGLQKLVPNGTETFDIQKMELADGGFDLTYTKPLSDATLADLADKYRVQQWTYVPTSAYGGPKVDEEDADRHRRVGLGRPQDGLAEDRRPQAQPRRLRALAAAVRGAGRRAQLLSTEAWYTLNTLPGYVAPVSDGLYELEDGLLTGGAQFDTEHAGYSGTGFVSGFGTVGASVKVDVDAAKAGDYRMALRYANGPNPFDGPKTISLIVNGTSRQITLPPTGAWPNYQLYVDDVALDAGDEHDRAQARGGRRRPRQPRLAAARARGHRRATRPRRPRSPAARTSRPSTPATAATGYVGGYQNQGASTTFEVTALADAPTEVTLGYANGPNPFAGTKEVSLYVNDQFVKKLALPDTGAWTDLRDVERHARAARREQRRLDPLRRGRRRQRQPRLPRRRAERADRSARRRSSPTTSSTATRSTAAAGRRSSTRIRPATRSPTASCRSRRRRATSSAARSAPATSCSSRRPTDGSWSATTKVSIDGTDDYVQAGLVAHASAGAWGKVVVMRRPTGEWVTELARESGFQNGPTLPAGAQNGITLQMIASDGQLRGRYSLDDGATWTEIGAGFPLAGLSAPGIGLSAYNGTGAEVGSFEYFHVGEPPTCRPRRRARSRTPRSPATRCCSTAPTSRSRTGRTPAAGSFVREGCTHQVRRRLRPAVHGAGPRGPVLAQARVDDARRRQLRRLRRLPRHRGEHGPDVDLAGRGDPDRRDGQPGPDHRRDLPRAGGGRRSPRRGAQPAG